MPYVSLDEAGTSYETWTRLAQVTKGLYLALCEACAQQQKTGQVRVKLFDCVDLEVYFFLYSKELQTYIFKLISVWYLQAFLRKRILVDIWTDREIEQPDGQQSHPIRVTCFLLRCILKTQSSRHGHKLQKHPLVTLTAEQMATVVNVSASHR